MYQNGEEVHAAIEDLRTRVAALEARPGAEQIKREVITELYDATVMARESRQDFATPQAAPPAD